MMILGSLYAGKFIAFFSKILKDVNITIDEKTKTWKISSKYRIDDPAFQNRYYTDIDNIMKAHPELYKEWRLSNTNIIIDTDPNSHL